MQATSIPSPSGLLPGIPVTGLLGSPPGELVLKICGGEHDGRVLRLTAAKCLIGSAPGCTLRLRARGIRPVHALILRGQAGSVIRGWSADTQLNDRAFSEALLEPGDKIQIGPITLSVAELAQETASPRVLAPRSSQPTINSPRRSTRNRRKQLFDVLRREKQQHSNLQTTINAQRDQLAAFEQQLEKLQAAAKEAATDSKQWAVAQPIELPAEADRLNQQLAKTIEQLRTELDAAAKRRTIEQQSAARQRATWEAQLKQTHQAELARLREELEAQQQNQAKQQQAAAINELQQQLAVAEQQRLTLAREVDLLKTALEAKTKAEELGRQSAASQIEQLSEAFDLVRQERDELFERLHAEQHTFDGQSFSLQAQIEETRRHAAAEIAEVQTAAQVQISQLRAEFARREQQFDEELIARTSSEGLRSAADAERIQKLTADLAAARSEAKSATATQLQQQDGFTQARKRLEAEIASLTNRLQQSDQAIHEARDNSGQLQAAVLAEAEAARAQRDAVHEQMLRQQQDWTEFRSRLETAANAERELAASRFEALEEELAASQTECLAAKSAKESLEVRLNQLQVELEQSQEALFATEHGVNQRLQQMTVSMENLQLDRTGEQSQLEQERAEWERERNSLAQCVADLQQEISRLQNQAPATSSPEIDAQLQAAQEQLAQWQAAAEQGRQQAAELSQAVARFRQQEQIWQLEREQLDQQQQSSNERLQQLEAAITELQTQLDEAQRAVAVTCPQPAQRAPQSAGFGSTINVNNQELAALCEQASEPAPSLAASQQADFGSTININNQDLAALYEQANEPALSLLAPRNAEPGNPQQAAGLQARELELQSQADELAEQQAQLEEEQAIVARQRIELEQFHASLLELEHTLTQRAEELLRPTPPHDPHASYVSHDFHDHADGNGPERESNFISESEAFAALADQVASLYNPVNEQPSLIHGPESVVEEPAPESVIENVIENVILPATNEEEPAVEEEPAGESLIIAAPVQEETFREELVEEIPSNAISHEPSFQEPVAEPTEQAEAFSEPAATVTPASEEDFDQELEARIARVMRRERTDWSTPPAADAPKNPQSENEVPEAAPPTSTQAVNSVLDRLKEAGLWKGEGTAKVDQLPSSNPPVDEGLCRVSHAGPIGAGPVNNTQTEEVVEEQKEEPQDNLELLSTPARSSLASSPAKEDDADDSIESYMSRLMQRLKSSDDEEPSPGKTTGASRAQATAKPAAPPPSPKPAESKPLTCLSEISPRSQAPELGANLAAMRELANSAARGAIESHRTKSKQQRVNLRTVNTLMALLVGAGFLFVWSRTGSVFAIGGIGLSLLWAVGSSVMAGLHTLKLRRAQRDSALELAPVEQPAEKPAE